MSEPTPTLAKEVFQEILELPAIAHEEDSLDSGCERYLLDAIQGQVVEMQLIAAVLMSESRDFRDKLIDSENFQALREIIDHMKNRRRLLSNESEGSKLIRNMVSDSTGSDSSTEDEEQAEDGEDQEEGDRDR